MSERVQLFKLKFPGKKISTTSIRKIYAEAGVKMKRLILKKEVPSGKKDKVNR